MKIRSVIVDSLQLQFLEGDIAKLSQLIGKIFQSKRNPIVLLAEDGDELLRKVPRLADCDLVFTTKTGQKYQGLSDGIHGAGTCAFYMPFDANYGDEITWIELEKTFLQLPYMNTVHRIVHKDNPFPWLITQAGTLYLKAQKNHYDLEQDTALHTLTL
jgi:hypothetical protein